jgi:16S rRNA (cytidine1402-2'-O)-methyltransferase
VTAAAPGAQAPGAPRPAGAAAGEGLLSMVGTPIGNLRDASPRVVETLAAADVVLCEDTRVTGRLLSCLGVRAPLRRCDENVIRERVPEVLGELERGRRVAFVSDAGMPGVSDPGQRLVDAALDRGLRVEVVPGPSAVTCALVASGLPMDHFFFEGFLPRKAGERDRRLRALSRVPGAVVLYESPHRVAATLEAVARALPERTVALLRELTKVHEECLRAPAAELAREVAERGEVRGECVIVVGGPTERELDSWPRWPGACGPPPRRAAPMPAPLPSPSPAPRARPRPTAPPAPLPPPRRRASTRPSRRGSPPASPRPASRSASRGPSASRAPRSTTAWSPSRGKRAPPARSAPGPRSFSPAAPPAARPLDHPPPRRVLRPRGRARWLLWAAARGTALAILFGGSRQARPVRRRGGGT